MMEEYSSDMSSTAIRALVVVVVMVVVLLEVAVVLQILRFMVICEASETMSEQSDGRVAVSFQEFQVAIAALSISLFSL